MSSHPFLRPLAMLAVALATPAVAQDQPESAIAGNWTAKQEKAGQKATAFLPAGKFAVPAIADDAVAGHFRSAASVYLQPRSFPSVDVLVYDHLSRCALAGTVDATGSSPTDLRWVRFEGSRRDLSAPSVAEDGLVASVRFVVRKGLSEGSDCPATINALYAQSVQNGRGVAKLTEHARYLLSGGAIGSEEAPLSDAALQSTLRGRAYAGAFLKEAKLVGVGSDAQHMLIMLGEPGGRSRFLAQYLNLPDGRWRFEGATSIGAALAAQLDKQGETQ